MSAPRNPSGSRPAVVTASQVARKAISPPLLAVLVTRRVTSGLAGSASGNAPTFDTRPSSATQGRNAHGPAQPKALRHAVLAGPDRRDTAIPVMTTRRCEDIDEIPRPARANHHS